MSCRVTNFFCRGSRLDIFFSFVGLSAPMILCSAAFIAVVLVYQVPLETNPNNSLFTITNSTVDPDAFYVDLDSTLLIIVASWMSIIAPFLSCYAISLATYPIAQRLLHDSEDNRRQRLPTPFQLSLIIGLIDGSMWAALWNLLRYNEFWKKRADRHATALASLSAVVLTTIMFSTVVFGADTWLHIATTSHMIQLATPLSAHLPSYGLILDAACTSTNNSFTAFNTTRESCTLDPSFDEPTMADGYDALKLLNNQSDSLSIFDLQDDPRQSLYYLGVPPTAMRADYDFRAETFALQTSCKPVSQACNLAMSYNISFDCNNSQFAMNDTWLFAKTLWNLFFRYPNFDDGGDLNAYNGVKNPFYVGSAHAVDILRPLSPSLLHDPEVSIERSVLAVVLACNVTVLDVTYDQVEGRIQSFHTKPSNTSTTNAIASAVMYTSFGLTNQKSTMDVESSAALSAQDLADSYAKSLSITLLAGAAGAFRSTPVLAAQQRQQILVSRLPKAPFFLLISANFCFPLLGIVLLILAARTTEDARQVRYRLSVAGVVASRFDKKQAKLPVDCTEEMFGEYNGKNSGGTIGIQHSTSGGYEYHAFREEKLLRHSASDESMERVESVEPTTSLREGGLGYIC